MDNLSVNETAHNSEDNRSDSTLISLLPNTSESPVLPAESPKIAASYQLLRMILIDSFSEGKIVSFDLDSPTSITGTNGSGKTTLLRLIPIFYGENPSKVINEKENFAKYYFKRKGSYVVFEYLKGDRKVMSVIHSSGEQIDKVEYRFINSAYKPEIFFQDEHTLVNSGDLFAHVTALRIDVTRGLNKAEYVKILQNTASPKEFRKERSLYAFCPANRNLKLLHRVVSGILNKTTSFTELKRMVVSTITDEDKDFNLNIKKSEISGWLNDYSAYELMMEGRYLIDDAIKNNIERKSYYDQLAKLAKQSERLSEDLMKLKAQKNEVLLQENNALNLLREAQEEKRSELSIALIDAKYLLDSITQKINHTHQKAKFYQEKKIDALLVEFDHFDANKKRIANINAEFEIVNHDITSIENDYAILINQDTASANDEINAIQVKINQLNESIYSNKKRIDENHYAQMQALLNQKEENILVLQSKLTPIENEIAVLKERQKNIPKNPTLTSKHNALSSTLADYQLEIDQHQESIRMKGLEKNTLQKEIDALDKKINAQQNILNQQKIELAQLKLSNNPDKSSLLYALRTHKPEWLDNIGRVINPELLTAKNLSPVFSDSDESQFYGMSINLEALSESGFPNEEMIQQSINTLIQVMDESEKTVKLLISEQQSLSKKMVAIEKETNELTVFLSMQREKLMAVKSDIDRVNFDIKKDLDLKQVEIESAITLSEKNKIQINQQIEQIKQSYTVNSQMETSQWKQTLSELDLKKSDEELYFTKQINQVRLDSRTRIEGLIVAKNNKIAGKNQEAKYQALAQEKTTLENSVQLVNENRGFINEYQFWLTHEFNALSEAEQKRTLLLGQVAQCEQSREESEADFNVSINQALTSIKRHEQLIAQLNEKEHILTSIITGLSGFNSKESTGIQSLSVEEDVYVLDKNRLKLVEQYQKSIVNIKENINQLNIRANKYPKSSCADYFNDKRQVFSNFGFQETEVDLWVNLFEDWFNVYSKSQLKNLTLLAMNTGAMIKDFKVSLSDYKQLVSNFNREIRSTLTQDTEFELIKNLRINVSTSIENQDYWGPLTDLELNYNLWRNMGDDVAPSKDFVHAFRQFSHCLDEGNMISSKPLDMLSIDIQVEVEGKLIKANNDAQLISLSSTGITYLVLSLIMLGFVDRVRNNNQSIVIHWPVDELGELYYTNILKLIKTLNKNNIIIVTAAPQTNHEVFNEFKHVYQINAARQVFVVENRNPLDSLNEINGED